MTPLLWAIALLALAIVIIVLEMFVPSGGVLAVCAAVSALAAVIIVFLYEGPVPGAIFLVISCVLLGITAAGVIRWWPHTALGRRMLNLPPGEELAVASPPNYDPLKELIGMYGMTVSKMVPGGVITIDGKSYDAISQAAAIDEGCQVRVVAVDGTRIMVRREDAVVASPGEASSTTTVTNDEDGDDDSRVIPNPFEDPLI